MNEKAPFDKAKAFWKAREFPKESRSEVRSMLMDYFRTVRELRAATDGKEKKILITKGIEQLSELTRLMYGSNESAAQKIGSISETYQDDSRQSGKGMDRSMGIVFGRIALINRKKASNK